MIGNMEDVRCARASCGVRRNVRYFPEMKAMLFIIAQGKYEKVGAENKPDVVRIDLQDVGLSSGFHDNHGTQ